MTDYAYHVTLKTLLPSIMEQGLLPHEHEWLDEPGIFVEPDEDAAAAYHEPPKTVMLRFALPRDASLDYYSEDLPEYIWDHRVPPERLERKTKAGWAPLLSSVAANKPKKRGSRPARR